MYNLKTMDGLRASKDIFKAQDSKPSKPKKEFSKNIISFLLILMLIAGAYSIISENLQKPAVISLSQLVEAINQGLVEKITVSGNDLEIKMKDGSLKRSRKEAEASLTETLVNYGVSKEELARVVLEVKNPSGFIFWLSALLPFLIPVLLLVWIFWGMSRQLKSSSLQAFSFGKSRARMIGPQDQKEKITFKDVAGVEEAKEELREIVEFLKFPKKFLDIGA